VYLYDRGYLVPLKDMRLDLNLHSTYFMVEVEGDDIILKGKGNGHRVGFCQEGAMHMAELEYTYLQILQFYYRGIQVMDSANLPIEESVN
jgi:stage II sporulation protein D